MGGTPADARRTAEGGGGGGGGRTARESSYVTSCPHLRRRHAALARAVGVANTGDGGVAWGAAGRGERNRRRPHPGTPL